MDLASPSHGPLSVFETLSGKELFVTGTTGFLGKVLVAHLLHAAPDIGHIHLLIRAGKTRHGRVSAADRFRQIALRSPAFRPLRERHGAELPAFLDAKVRVWEGDVTDEACGLSDADIAALAPQIDAVIHVAGLTDFEPDPKKALEVNVKGALRILEVTSRFERAIMIHTSTCYVAGERSGRVLEALAPKTPKGQHFDAEAEFHIAQRIAQQGGHGHEGKAERQKAANERVRLLGQANIYTYTKALAEHLLAQRAPLNGTRRPVPLTIVRPAIIECATSFPFAGWNEGINTTGPLLWLLKGPFRHLPCKPKNHFDVVPVDTCTRAMIAVTAAALVHKARPVYQIGTSSSNPLTMGRGIELNNLAVRKDLGTSSSKLERWGIRFLDGVAVGADENHFFAPGRLRGLTRELKSLVASFGNSKLPQNVARGRETAEMMLEDVDKTLSKVERMLELYRPFIHDNDWIFDNAQLRALDHLLDDASRAAFGWDGDAIDWRRYWLDVLYPGLNKWCLPLLEGGQAPDDPMPAWAAKPRTPDGRVVSTTVIGDDEGLSASP